MEENAISLIEDADIPLRTIRARYPALPEPVTLRHDLIDYVFEQIPDEKYRNYWLTLQEDVINRIDYRPYCRPAVLQIEPTNTCNLSCALCPVGKGALGRPPRHMSLDEFKKIVDETEHHAMLLVLWDWGEPFMNPELTKMIQYATDRDIRTVVSTNAYSLRQKELATEVLQSGLSTLIVAIDSPRPAAYREFRKRGSLPQALEGLKQVVAAKRATGSQTIINLRMVVTRQNERDVKRMQELGRQIGVDVFTIKTANPGYEREGSDAKFVPRNPRYRRLEYKPGTWQRVRVKEECRRLWSMINISSDGNVIPCCYDYNGSMKVGNVFEDSFGEIWEGERLASLRKYAHTDRESLPHCSQCIDNYKHMPHGMFCEPPSDPQGPPLALRFYIRLYTHTPEPIRLIARKLKRLVQRREACDPGSSAEASPSFPASASAIYPLGLPLPADYETGFRSYPIFDRKAASIGNLASHASVLTKDTSPHPPHVHDEEEILFLLAGEVDLIFHDKAGPTGVRTERLRAEQFVYYPAGFAHTLRAVSNVPANYVMFKWKSDLRQERDVLPFMRYDVQEREAFPPAEEGFQPKLAFEGPTGYLTKLQCHVSTLAPGAGYEPHIDDYHVGIIVIRGELETLGKRVLPYGIIFYSAGEPHGMRNSGQSTAKYVVFEFHGR